MFETLAYMIMLPFMITNQTDLSLGQSYTLLCVGTGGSYGPASAEYIERHGPAYYACDYTLERS